VGQRPYPRFFARSLLQGKSILTAQADRAGNVWFGLYEGGVVVFDGSRFRSYSERDGLAGGFVDAVFVDDGGTIWIGAERGLSRLEGQKFVTWTIANGFLGSACYGFSQTALAGCGSVTAPEVASVSRSELDRAAGDPSHRVAYSFLDDGDGLKGNPDRHWQSPAVRASDGKFWFRTSEGVAVIDPQELTKNPVPPAVHIERMVADGAAVAATQAVQLQPLTRNVEFDYTASVSPSRARFSFATSSKD